MVTFDDFLGLGLSPRTAYLYARLVDRVVPLLAERGTDLAGCGAIDVVKVAERFSRSHSQRQLLRSALVAAWDVLDRLDAPVRALRVPPRPRGRCRALTEQGARQLESAAWELRHDDCGLAVLIGLYTGMRRAEIARIRWDDLLVDETGRLVLIRVFGKGDVEDTVPVHPVLADVFTGRARGGRWMFKGRHPGQPVSPATVWHWVRQVSAHAGLPPVTTHQLRHTMLAECNDRTGNLRATQQIARHSKIDTTTIYTRTTQEMLRQVVAAVDYGRRSA